MQNAEISFKHGLLYNRKENSFDVEYPWVWEFMAQEKSFSLRVSIQKDRAPKKFAKIRLLDDILDTSNKKTTKVS